MVIGLSSQRVINVRDQSSTVKVHPPYYIPSSQAVSSQSIGIGLTPNAPEEIVQSAFDLRLNCIWSFAGCRRWSELLPSIEPLTRK